MGSSLTGLDTLFSSGLESWSSWQLDCSQPRGRVRRNGSNVMSGRAGRRESQQTGGDFQSFLALHHSNDSASDGPQSPATSIETQETPQAPPAGKSPDGSASSQIEKPPRGYNDHTMVIRDSAVRMKDRGSRVSLSGTGSTHLQIRTGR